MGLRAVWFGCMSLLWAGTALGAAAPVPEISPSPYWKHDLTFPEDGYRSFGTDQSVRWVKFVTLRPPYDPNAVYFQDSRRYPFHHTFASAHLDPFLGMTPAQFNAVSLFAENQEAVLGTVLYPPGGAQPIANEVAIQFVRQDPFTREELRDLFQIVRVRIALPEEGQVFYFPTYEQQPVAYANREWFLSQGIPVDSAARWATGNTCYAPGWAVGTLRYHPPEEIDVAYRSGVLGPEDILLTDGIPAELPHVAGILSLVPATPNSHVAILAQTYRVPFAHLALEEDAFAVQALVGRPVVYSAFTDDQGACHTRLIDISHLVDAPILTALQEAKRPMPLAITPMSRAGSFGISTDTLLPADIALVGGKAANFGLLRTAIPDASPPSLALSFDLWQAVLDLPVQPVPEMTLNPGEFMVFWADGQTDLGADHVSFRLSLKGESLAVVDRDGQTLIDVVQFGSLTQDLSYGRNPDGSGTWRLLPDATPGQPNGSPVPASGAGLVINELMAGNDRAVPLPGDTHTFPDWFELYNASDQPLRLNGLYLTDDLEDPTQWQIPPATSAGTLRDAIATILEAERSYPPADRLALSADLASIRSLFTNETLLPFPEPLRDALLATLTDPLHGFDPQAMLRFRSSTNVEDSEAFSGAGLYDSYSGCLADSLAEADGSVCLCDPNRSSARSVWTAIRKTMASFYNENAFLERLRRSVDEADVGMGLLVHHSFPDAIELANGVATISAQGLDESQQVHLVTQKGAVSVTNPQGDAIPETVTLEILPGGRILRPSPRAITQSSNLVVLGGTVLDWTEDYVELSDLLYQVSEAYRAVTGKSTYTLDLEYKKVAPGGAVRPDGGLVVKQVRPVPSPDQTETQDVFLLNVPVTYEVYTGGFTLTGPTDVFASHRLKMRLRLETHNLHLSDEHVNAVYSVLDLNTPVGQQGGAVSSLPGSSESWNQGDGILTWKRMDLLNARTYTLFTAGLPHSVSMTENPVYTLADLGILAAGVPYRCLTLDVDYEQPVPSWRQQVWPSDPPSGLGSTLTDRVYLWAPPAPSVRDLAQERTVMHQGITCTARFYFPPAPGEFAQWGVNNTAPLLRWESVRIGGLTGAAFELTHPHALTYCPEKHNLIENILCEPQREPSLSSAVRAELEGQDIRYLQVIIHNEDPAQSEILIHGF